MEEDLKRRRLTSSHLVAERITSTIYQYVRQDQFDTPAKLLQEVKKIGHQLQQADKLNFVVPNTIKRILHIIREACHELKLDKHTDEDIKGMEDFGKVEITKLLRKSSDDSQLQNTRGSLKSI